MADIRKRKQQSGISYQVRFSDPATASGYGYKSFKTHKTAQAFKAERDLEETDLLRGTGVATEIRSVTQAIDRWLDICERTGRDGREPIERTTLNEYRRHAAVMRRYPWDKPIQQLVTADVVRFRSWLLEKVSRDLARRTLSSFHSVLIEMKLQGVIRDDPALGITIRASGRYDDKTEVPIPSDADVRAILAAADTMGDQNAFMAKVWARYRPMVYLMAFSGMRSSEILGLAWPDLHRTHIDVRQRSDALRMIGPVKSKSGRRRIELSRRVTDMIFAWRPQCPASEHDLVFPTASGRPVSKDHFRTNAWLPLLRAVGLTTEIEQNGRVSERPNFTPHALRHYYASKLIEKRKDAKFIQERMGHASIEITFDVYGHLMKDREAAHQQTAEELADELLPV